jgi:hypothetical protein
MGYTTLDMSEVQDNWVYSVTTKAIKRFNNLPSYVKISPQSFDSEVVQIQATQGTASAQVKVDYSSIEDVLKVQPVLPDLPDFRVSTNTTSIFSIPRSKTSGNGLKFSISSTGPAEYVPLVFNTQKYAWTLTNPIPAKWTPYYAYGN